MLLLLHNGTGALASEATAPATLLLVRHGHVGDNTPGPAARLCGWLDPPLSELGRRQAERLRCRLEAGPRPAALYCSSLRRARETAAPAAGALGLRPRQRRALREISCGHLEGRRVDDVRREHPELWEANLRQSDGRFRWPGGESYRAFRGRVLRALGEIALAHPGERVLVVTHAGVITQALGALAGASPARWGAFRAGNASVTELRWDASGGAVLRFDDRSHLEGSPPVRASR